jgi:hypothetical protein
MIHKFLFKKQPLLFSGLYERDPGFSAANGGGSTLLECEDLKEIIAYCARVGRCVRQP